jgi:hypothetical protein
MMSNHLFKIPHALRATESIETELFSAISHDTAQIHLTIDGALHYENVFVLEKVPRRFPDKFLYQRIQRFP